MRTISFIKMSGAGNDFIMIKSDDLKDFIMNKSAIEKLCDRHNGIGADGLIIMSISNSYDFEMNYFNADGSGGSLCGNGARCAMLFAKKNNWIKSSITRFISDNAEYSGEIISDELIKFNLASPTGLKLNFKVKAGNQLITAHYINTGSPHIIIFIDDILTGKNPFEHFTNINDIPVISLGREIRFLPEFSPGGVNVNFVQLEGNTVKIRTYERGVEDETLACGTGSVASAIVANLLKNISLPVTLITRGNDKLLVTFDRQNQNFINVSLTGPVREIFTGSIQINFLE